MVGAISCKTQGVRHWARRVALTIASSCAVIAAHVLPTPIGTTTFALAASPEESIHLALGTPTDADPIDDYLIRRSQYVVSYNHTRNGPNWAAWRLTGSDYGGQARHKGHFLPDESLPTGWYRVTHVDYSNTGYDRGHLVRSEDRTGSRVDNDATFLLTNILPQRHDLNGGPWLGLENACRSLAKGSGKVLYIVTGGIFASTPQTIGHGVAVPSAFWKVVVVLGPGQGPADVTASTPTIAVVMPNSEGIEGIPWRTYRTTIVEVERQSGYRLFGKVAEPVRRALLTAKGWSP